MVFSTIGIHRETIAEKKNLFYHGLSQIRILVANKQIELDRNDK